MNGPMNRTTATPVPVPRTRRKHPVRNMTSLPAGKVVPLVAIPLLREDSMVSRFAVAFEMQETVEILLNGIDVVCEAWLVPNLSDTRFRTQDDLNLAYTGGARAGDAPIPYFDTMAAGDPLANQIHMRLGKHAKAGKIVNNAYVWAYNMIINQQREEVSPNIPQRERLDKTLAQALWPRNMFAHIVPDFDQAVMEGEVALNIAQQNLAIKGITSDRYVPVSGDGTTEVKAQTSSGDKRLRVSTGGAFIIGEANPPAVVSATGLSGLRADLQGAVAVLADNGITISLANIDMARKAQVFANIRKKYNMHEDMLIKLLMDGMRITDQEWRKPIRLARTTTQFGMAKRYASNGDALTQSVVNGAAALEFAVNCPAVPGGGMIMIVASIAPEQMFERQEDPYLVARTPDDLPSFLADHLDPEAVEVVLNSYIDSDHDQPDDVYGYAPMGHKWNTAGPGIGGRFYRPEVDAGFDEDRQSLWAVETQNPTLTEDAYLVPADIHLKPFWTSTIDPFDAITIGLGNVTGLTQFGPMLIEALPESDYDAVMAEVDQSRIEK